MKRLYRSRTNRVFTGLCAGLGNYAVIDPIAVRILFIALTCLGGSGIIIYIITSIVVPPKPINDGFQDADFVDTEPEEPTSANADAGSSNQRSTSNEVSKNKSLPVIKLIFGIVLIAIGMFLLMELVFPQMTRFWFPMIFVAVGLLILVQAVLPKGRSGRE